MQSSPSISLTSISSEPTVESAAPDACNVGSSVAAAVAVPRVKAPSAISLIRGIVARHVFESDKVIVLAVRKEDPTIAEATIRTVTYHTRATILALRAMSEDERASVLGVAK